MGQPYVCPWPACGHEGEPVRGRERLRARSVWLCDVCRGRLPIRTVPRERRKTRTTTEW